MAKKSAASKGYRKQNAKKPFLTKKEIVILCVIAAVVIAGFVLLLNYDDGALKVVDGKAAIGGENWLVTNGAAAQNGARFFKVGEVGDIAGYSRASQNGLYGENTPEYVYTPEDEASPVEHITVSTYPAKAERLAEYYAELLPGYADVTNIVSDIQNGEAGGTPYTYYIYTTEPAADENADAETAETDTDGAAKIVSAYIDTIKDSSVSVSVSNPAPTLEECLSDADLLTALNQAVEAIKLESK